jgi:hypothetical protein
MSSQIKATLNKPLWGGKTLYLGEMASLGAAIVLAYFFAKPLLHNVWFWVVLAVCVLAMIVW